MTNNALVYLVEKLFYRIIQFFRHWYVKSMRIYFNFVMDQLKELDYFLAWRITLKHLLEPLYKDYTILGYILGFGFRLGRLLVSSFIYLIVFTIAIGFYIIWLVAPIYILSRVFF
ncbi:MAG: hypothetical protein QMD65_01655 [Patescibacteria group bacterium]|nr:hypothetical protein [Patescibacteria group bacterium]